MIRNVVVHIANEQPLVADIFEMPTATDVGLVCTNIRSLDGKKPIFIDHAASVFVFPYLNIRFLEIPPGAVTGLTDGGIDTGETADAGLAPDPEPDEELELDEDFLRRIREA